MWNNIDYGLNRMKADKLSEAGRELEELTAKLTYELEIYRRRERILTRIDSEIDSFSFCKRRKYRRLKLKIKEEMYGKPLVIKDLALKHEKAYNNFIIIRESLGANEHSWIEDFYRSFDLRGIE